MRLTSRPATHADVARWHDYTCSYKAWVCEIDGEPRGIIGLALTRPIACAFSAFDEELRPHLKSMTVLRLIQKLRTTIEARGLPVMAIAEATEPTAPAILRRLGFAYVGEHDGDSVFEWGD